MLARIIISGIISKMLGLQIDRVGLEQGLEIGAGNTSWIFANSPQSCRLRLGACGLFATAIDQYLQQEEVASQLVIIEPHLKSDPEMRHVFNIVGGKTSGVILDATYSQFLKDFGVRIDEQSPNPTHAFPDTKIVLIETDNLSCSIGSIASKAAGNASSDLEAVLSAVWDIGNATEWQPPERVVCEAQIISRQLPPGLVSWGSAGPQ